MSTFPGTTMEEAKDDILALLSEILDDTPPLTLSDGPQFSPDIANGLKPLMDYIRKIVVSKEYPPEARAKATSILFGIALARGSLHEFLSVCRVLLQCNAHVKSTGHNEQNSFAVVPFLKALIEFKPEGVDASSSARAGSSRSGGRSAGSASTNLLLPGDEHIQRRHSLASVGPGVLTARRRSSTATLDSRSSRRGSAPDADNYSDEKEMEPSDVIERDIRLFPYTSDAIMHRCGRLPFHCQFGS